MDPHKEFGEAILGIVLFGTLLIFGVFAAIVLSMRIEASFGAGHGFRAGVATLVACWGFAFYVLYKVFARAAGVQAPSRKA